MNHEPSAISRLRDLTIEHLWRLAVLGSCFGYVCALPLQQYDFWHYLKAGEVMYCTRQVLSHDFFSFTIPPHQFFVNLHWGSQVIYYLLYRLGGIPLLELAHAALITTAFILLFRIAWKHSASLRIASGVTFIAFLVSASNFALRPQGFSIFFFAVTLYLLKSRRLWLLPPVMLLWANVHGAFVLGLVLIGIEWIGSIRWNEDRRLRMEARGSSVLLALIACWLTTLLTPWGLSIYPALVNAEAASRASLITEWDPPSLHDATGVLFFAALLGLIVLRNFTKKRWGRTEALTFLAFTLLALREQRAVVWWAMATVPLFVDALSELVARRPREQTPVRNLWHVNWAISLLFSAYLIGCLPWLKARNPFLPSIKRQLIAGDTPVAIADRLRAIPDAHRIFNNFSWGGYFIWKLREDQKVFFDPRVLVFPETVMGDYLLISNGHASWRKLLDHYGVDTLSLSKEEQRLLLPLVKGAKDWKQVYEDGLGVIFMRQKMKGV